MAERLRAIGGVLVHLFSEPAWKSDCGYYPALGWAGPDQRDQNRPVCRKCAALQAPPCAPGGEP